MKTDGIFTQHHFTIQTALDRPEWFVPSGDIHHDSPAHAASEFAAFLAYMKRERPNAYGLGMGDYIDTFRAHERAMLEGVDCESATDYLNDMGKRASELIAEKLTGIKWIGLLGGNHFINLTLAPKRGAKVEMHSDAYIAQLLGCPYLGVCSAIVITLVDRRRNLSADWRVIAHHGAGGATTVGGAINRVQRFLDGWAADCALMGHDHQRGILPTRDRISFDGLELSSSVRYVGRTGSFLRGYVPDHPSYVTDAALTPSSLGWIEFELRLKVDERGKAFVHARGLQ